MSVDFVATIAHPSLALQHRTPSIKQRASDIAMPSSFILAPTTPSSSSSSTPSQTKEELHLLPFSLSYSGPAKVSSYFRPRPAPSSHAYAGSTIATFRGRALVGQKIEVPRGYRGVILSADALNYTGAGSSVSASISGSGSGSGQRGAPLTPAPSSSSAVSEYGAEGEGEGTGIKGGSDGGRVTRAKAKGAGQVALSRPRARTTRGRAKRIALDSDEEEEEGEVVRPMPKRSRPVPAQESGEGGDGVENKDDIELAGSKGEAGSGGDGDGGAGEVEAGAGAGEAKAGAGEGEGGDVRSRLQTPDVPAIVVVHATPGPSQPARCPPSPRPTASPTPSPTSSVEPAPSALIKTEDPANPGETFQTDSTSTDFKPAQAQDESRQVQRARVQLDDNEDPTDVRILYPSSTFTHITLWTPDAPMPGFVADELESKVEGAESHCAEAAEAAEGEMTAEGAESKSSAEKGEKGEGVGQVRRSWWRQGGAGEGGDEFVRGLGEWIGLGEIVSCLGVLLQLTPTRSTSRSTWMLNDGYVTCILGHNA